MQFYSVNTENMPINTVNSAIPTGNKPDLNLFSRIAITTSLLLTSRNSWALFFDGLLQAVAWNFLRNATLGHF